MLMVRKRVAVAAILFALGVIVGWSLPRVTPQPTPAVGRDVAQPTTTASVLVDFDDGRITTYADIPMTAGGSVWQLMETLQRTRSLAIESKDFGSELGVLVTGIDGVLNDAAADRFWHYWVNLRFAQVGASAYRVNPGDQVMWKYTSGEFRAETQ